MKVLLILLIVATLFFGAMFPAFVVISGFLALVFMFTGMLLSLSEVFGGKQVTVYKNDKRADSFGNRSDDKHTADNPEVIVSRNRVEESYNNWRICFGRLVIVGRNRAEEGDVSDFGQYAEDEIIELPTDVVSKED